MRFRVLIEVKWFLFLSLQPCIKELTEIQGNSLQRLESLYQNFDLADAERIKEIEAKTNHDVKAVEYFIKDKLQDCDELLPQLEFIHFACTSEDINNLAYALMIKEGRDNVFVPSMENLVAKFADMAKHHADQPLLSRTHAVSYTHLTLPTKA